MINAGNDPHSWKERIRLRVENAFAQYTRLEGLREAYYLGVESCNCCGMLPNEYPPDDPKHKAWQAGFELGIEMWGSQEL